MKKYVLILLAVITLYSCQSPRPDVDIQRTFFGITTGDTITRQSLADSLRIPLNSIVMEKGDKEDERIYTIKDRNISFADKKWNTITIKSYQQRFYQIIFFDFLSEHECQEQINTVFPAMREKYTDAIHHQKYFDKDEYKAKMSRLMLILDTINEDGLDSFISELEQDFQIHFWLSKGIEASFQTEPIGNPWNDNYARQWIRYTDENIIKSQSDNLYQNL